MMSMLVRANESSPENQMHITGGCPRQCSLDG
jgi:hypothetical protein